MGSIGIAEDSKNDMDLKDYEDSHILRFFEGHDQLASVWITVEKAEEWYKMFKDYNKLDDNYIENSRLFETIFAQGLEHDKQFAMKIFRRFKKELKKGTKANDFIWRESKKRR